MSLDIKLKRVDKVYQPGDSVAGVVVVTTKGPLSHNGVTLVLDGSVNLQLSAKSVGLFEAFYNSLKPVQLISYNVDLAPPGKFPDGTTELPFEFPLQAVAGETLFETYHGVFVNIQYSLRCDMQRGVLAKNLAKALEFMVEQPDTNKGIKPSPVPFTITPDSLENIKSHNVTKVPSFKIVGKLSSSVCAITKPFTGELLVESSNVPIKSVELQLVRVETCGTADGYAKEATEIQNIQIAEGDVCRNLVIPMYMVFPRLFTCPTLATKTFKIEFEVNLVVLLADGHLITENFPIRLFRP